MLGINQIFTSVRKVDRTFNTFVHYEQKKHFYCGKIRKERKKKNTNPIYSDSQALKTMKIKTLRSEIIQQQKEIDELEEILHRI